MKWDSGRFGLLAALAVAAAGLLAGCGRGAAGLKPGLYEQRFQSSAIVERPGLPPRIEQRALEPRRVCIGTIAPDHPERFLALPAGARCRFFRAVWAKGKADIAGVCLTGAGSPPFHTSVTGVYRRTAFDVALRMTTRTPEIAVDTTLQIAARRLGACPAEKGG